MTAIVAIEKNGGIGYKNNLPWPKNSEDLKFFKELTYYQNIIVGYNTFKSLPPLKNRYIKVLTRQIDLLSEDKEKFRHGEYFNLSRFFGKKEFLEWAKNDIICGGAQVYKSLVPDCDQIYITHINGEYKCDTFFPFSLKEIESLFPQNELIKEFDGNKIIRYYK